MAQTAQTLAVITTMEAALAAGSDDKVAHFHEDFRRRFAKRDIANNSVFVDFASVLHQLGRDVLLARAGKPLTRPFPRRADP